MHNSETAADIKIWGGASNEWGHNLLPLVGIGLTHRPYIEQTFFKGPCSETLLLPVCVAS